jgi:hypothetical protein
MARQWGDHRTDEDLPFAVAYGQGYSGGVIGNNSVGTLGVGSFTMPWAGTLSATLTISATWPQNGHQQWYVHFGASSPYPTANSVLTTVNLNDLNTHRGQLPAYATWANLVKGQGVTFGINVGVGGGGTNLTLEWWTLNIKAWP